VHTIGTRLFIFTVDVSLCFLGDSAGGPLGNLNRPYNWRIVYGGSSERIECFLMCDREEPSALCFARKAYTHYARTNNRKLTAHNGPKNVKKKTFLFTLKSKFGIWQTPRVYRSIICRLTCNDVIMIPTAVIARLIECDNVEVVVHLCPFVVRGRPVCVLSFRHNIWWIRKAYHVNFKKMHFDYIFTINKSFLICSCNFNQESNFYEVKLILKRVA